MAFPPPVSIAVHSYTWIFAVTMVFAFLDAFSIGANDVANSFATSVSSRSLKLWQAVCIAVFTEFGGAILLGASVVSTVKDGIIQVKNFNSRPDLLMSGFMCALISSSSWVMFATFMGFPVSTTHSIIGALIGIGISAYGFDSVNWGWNNKGVAQVVSSWFISPAVAGIIAVLVYQLTLHLVMKRQNSLKKGIYAIPIYFTITIFIVSFYVVSKNGASTLKIENKGGKVTIKGNVGLCFGIIGAITGAVAIFTTAFVVPFFWRKLVDEERLRWYHLFLIWFTPKQPQDEKLHLVLKRNFTPHLLTEEDRIALGMPMKRSLPAKAGSSPIIGSHHGIEETERDAAAIEDQGNGDEEDLKKEHPPRKFLGVVETVLNFLKTRVFAGMFMDVASIAEDNHAALAAHEQAVIYDNKTEYLYSMLQVVTASFASFAHGSNDVANALGPLTGVYQIWTTGKASSKADVPTWMLAYGGAGIDLGLALYGYNVMRNLGNNITYHSPSRGFCMELGAALSVITASFLALPVSTTQCITGATIAVGLSNGNLRAVNWRMVGVIFFSWILTIPITASAAGLLYAVLTRGPSFTTAPS